MSLGLGVMIRMLGGREVFDLSPVKGSVIASVAIDDVTLTLTFADGRKLVVKDEGQSCCEHRYMQTDDDLSWFVGAELRDVELRDGGEQEESDGEAHEMQFIHVVTSKGVLNICSHNEHNGYYGGFSLEARIE